MPRIAPAGMPNRPSSVSEGTPDPKSSGRATPSAPRPATTSARPTPIAPPIHRPGTGGDGSTAAPAIARVHGYLLSRQAPLTEREVREALGLSHRAASMALAESEAWGLVERVPEPRRVGRRGPAGVAYVAIGDHWRWFGRVVAQRKMREGDPVIQVLAEAVEEATKAAREYDDDPELVALRGWLSSFNDFV